MRPLKNAQFYSSARKAKILTTGIHGVFRGIKFEPDAEIEQKGAFCNGLGMVDREEMGRNIAVYFILNSFNLASSVLRWIPSLSATTFRLPS